MNFIQFVESYRIIKMLAPLYIGVENALSLLYIGVERSFLYCIQEYKDAFLLYIGDEYAFSSVYRIRKQLFLLQLGLERACSTKYRSRKKLSLLYIGVERSFLFFSQEQKDTLSQLYLRAEKCFYGLLYIYTIYIGEK